MNVAQHSFTIVFGPRKMRKNARGLRKPLKGTRFAGGSDSFRRYQSWTNSLSAKAERVK